MRQKSLTTINTSMKAFWIFTETRRANQAPVQVLGTMQTPITTGSQKSCSEAL